MHVRDACAAVLYFPIKIINLFENLKIKIKNKKIPYCIIPPKCGTQLQRVTINKIKIIKILNTNNITNSKNKNYKNFEH